MIEMIIIVHAVAHTASYDAAKFASKQKLTKPVRGETTTAPSIIHLVI